MLRGLTADAREFALLATPLTPVIVQGGEDNGILVNYICQGRSRNQTCPVSFRCALSKAETRVLLHSCIVNLNGFWT